MLSLFEAILVEDAIRDFTSPQESRSKLKKQFFSNRGNDTIDWSESYDPVSDNYVKGPIRTVEPTEDGYPGLEPPVG